MIAGRSPLLIGASLFLACGRTGLDSGADQAGEGDVPPAYECPFGFATCVGDSTGCETEVAASDENCGACRRRCPGGLVCAAGACHPPREIVEISAGIWHACARRASGEVLCWGQNDIGQLGRGYTSEFEPRPAPIAGVSDAVQVASNEGGNVATCVRRRGGGIACWGSGLGYALGNGSDTDSSTPVETGPAPAAAGIALSMERYGLAVTTGGELWGWGSGRTYVFDTDPSSRKRPGPLPVGGVVQVAARTASCAIFRSGRVACWGDNHYGDIGGVNRNTRVDPVAPLEMPGIDHAVALRAAWDMIAIDASGAVFVWGCWSLACGFSSAVPMERVAGVTEASAADSGPLHSCVLLRSGRVRCWHFDQGWWGEDVYAEGLLGVGYIRTTSSFEYPESSDVPGIADAVGLDVGSVFTCVLRQVGRVSCWGDNRFGQLGDGTSETRDAPVDVIGLD